MMPIRSNVVPIDPIAADDELARRLAESVEVQRRFFLRYGLVVVPTRGKVANLPRFAQMAVESWSRERLGITGRSER